MSRLVVLTQIQSQARKQIIKQQVREEAGVGSLGAAPSVLEQQVTQTEEIGTVVGPARTL